jgi:hypothetical protein
MTAVPRFPQPIIPIRMAELADVPKTVEGFKMVNTERAAVSVMNFLRLMVSIVIFG